MNRLLQSIFCFTLLFSGLIVTKDSAARDVKAWPWMGEAGSINFFLAGNSLAATQKFSAGEILNSKKGDKIAVFEDKPVGTKKVTSIFFDLSYVVYKNFKIGYTTQWLSVKNEINGTHLLPNPTSQSPFEDEDAGMGDHLIDVQYHLPNRRQAGLPSGWQSGLPSIIPIVVYGGLVIPSNDWTFLAEDIDLSGGFLSPLLGVSFGYKPWRNLYIYTSQQYVFPARREDSISSYGNTTTKIFDKDKQWYGSLNLFYSARYWEFFTSFDVLKSADFTITETITRPQFVGTEFYKTESIDIGPYFEYTLFNVSVSQKWGRFKISESVSIPLRGVEVDASPTYQIAFSTYYTIS